MRGIYWNSSCFILVLKVVVDCDELQRTGQPQFTHPVISSKERRQSINCYANKVYGSIHDGNYSYRGGRYAIPLKFSNSFLGHLVS